MKNELAFQTYVNDLCSSKYDLESVFDEAFVGPSSAFAAALSDGSISPAVLLGDIKKIQKVIIDYLKISGETEHHDQTLLIRWQALTAAVQFLATWDHRYLTDARNLFQDAYEKLDRRYKKSSVRIRKEDFLRPEFNKLLSEHQEKYIGPESIFDEPWNVGTILLYDWLLGSLKARAPAETIEHGERSEPVDGAESVIQKLISEKTPILSVKNGKGSVQHLVVEKRNGAVGLVLPDFFKVGLVGFPPWNNFVVAMNDGFSAGLYKQECSRLTWHLEALPGQHPRNLSGRSAQVAAACCALALAERKQGDAALLDERVAVTACLGPAAKDPKEWVLRSSTPGNDPEEPNTMMEAAATSKQRGRAMQPHEVEQRNLHAKFKAAAEAGLVAVLVCESQIPQTPSEKSGNQSVLIQPITTLDDAYDSLLITSKAIVEYKKKVVKTWKDKWNEEPTGDEFKK